MVPEMGSGHRAGGADLASGVDTAGTVARIDLRLPHNPVCEVASADRPMRPLGSLSGSRPPGLCGDTSAARHHLPYLYRPLDRHCPHLLSSYQLFAGRLGVTHARLVV